MFESSKEHSAVSLARGQLRVVWPFLCVILLQLACASSSVYVLAAIRSSLVSENTWIRSQQEAVYQLRLYLETGEDDHFRRYQASVAVPLAFHVAYRALFGLKLDLEQAYQAADTAGLQPADASRDIWFFRLFSWNSYVAIGIGEWGKVNILTQDLDRLAADIRAERPWMGANPADLTTWSQQIEAINEEIAAPVLAFSQALGTGARLVEWTLMSVNLALAVGLCALTMVHVRRYLKQRQMTEDRLSWQASHDALTGIPNRRAFEAALTGLAGRPHSVMFLDLDQFKIINDTCGHGAGDELLRNVAMVLRDRFKGSSFLARLGGDEFSVLLSDCAEEQAVCVAEELRVAVQDFAFFWNRRAFRVTASIGLVHSCDGANDPEHMMREADMACFMAKEKGRNRVHLHRPGDQDLLRQAGEMNWVQRIHQALREDQFCLFAQMIVPLAAGPEDGLHVELLIRLRDASGALIPPGTFLPAAERYGLMGLIDRWVVTAAFKVLAARQADPRAEPIACCAINLSGKTIGDEAFLVFLEEAFAEFRISPSVICFEITETSAITNLEAAKGFVRDLRALGCRFSLDDFGAGMSSFAYLKHLPVDFLKIDGGFVKNLLSDEVDRAMVEAINAVGHVMGKSIIAEFVETDALARALNVIGVDYGQGYGIAKPKPFDLGFGSDLKCSTTDLVREVA